MKLLGGFGILDSFLREDVEKLSNPVLLNKDERDEDRDASISASERLRGAGEKDLGDASSSSSELSKFMTTAP